MGRHISIGGERWLQSSIFFFYGLKDQGVFPQIQWIVTDIQRSRSGKPKVHTGNFVFLDSTSFEWIYRWIGQRDLARGAGTKAWLMPPAFIIPLKSMDVIFGAFPWPLSISPYSAAPFPWVTCPRPNIPDIWTLAEDALTCQSFLLSECFHFGLATYVFRFVFSEQKG